MFWIFKSLETYNICFTCRLSVGWRWSYIFAFLSRFLRSSEWKKIFLSVESDIRRLSYCISISFLFRALVAFNGLISAPNKIPVNIIPAKINMPIFQPNFPMTIFANGPKDNTPTPVPAVTKPSMNRLVRLSFDQCERFLPFAKSRYLSK